MPIFMDRHDIGKTTPESVAAAHEQDLRLEKKYRSKALTYWFDQDRGTAFCLIEAPDAAAVESLHREAHGLIPNEVIEVDPVMVESFLGRIRDPEATVHGDSARDSAFRAIMFSDIEGSTELGVEVGDDGLMAVLQVHDRIIEDAIARCSGHVVKHTGDGYMASFVSIAKAVECAIRIQRGFAEHRSTSADFPVHVRIGLSAGEPVQKGEDFFGSTVNLAARLCGRAGRDGILASHVVGELCLGKNLPFEDRGPLVLKGFKEPQRAQAVTWDT